MDNTLIASILAITYGLVEAIKWLIKGLLKTKDKEQNKESITIILEKLKTMQHTQEQQERKITDIIRILDRITLTQTMLAEVIKDSNKMITQLVKRKRK